MVFGLFGQRKRIETLRSEVQESFKHVRKDVNKISDWIKYLEDKDVKRDEKMQELTEEVKRLAEELETLSETSQFLSKHQNKQVKQTNVNTQTVKIEHQTSDQTSVQTSDLDKLTVMERAVVWALMNSEVKLSYEDIGTLLGKEKSTIRGQVNSIKQKIPHMISERQEPNGKKRLYIAEDMRKNIIKKTKIKVKNEKN